LLPYPTLLSHHKNQPEHPASLVHHSLTNLRLIACASIFLRNLHHQYHRANLSIQPLQSCPDEHLKVDEPRKFLEGALMHLDEACHTLNAPKLKHTMILEQLLKKNIDDEQQLS
jgi:hypothetical protein